MTKNLRLRVLDDEHFMRSKSGAIWGRVYFEVEDECFPDSGWTDLIAGFSAAWLNALVRISSGAPIGQVHFMDGPFAIDILAEVQGVAKLRFLHKGVLKQSSEARISDLLESAIVAGKRVLTACERRGWAGSDVVGLAEALRNGLADLRA